MLHDAASMEHQTYSRAAASPAIHDNPPTLTNRRKGEDVHLSVAENRLP